LAGLVPVLPGLAGLLLMVFGLAFAAPVSQTSREQALRGCVTRISGGKLKRQPGEVI
jgi:hypothetical protein